MRRDHVASTLIRRHFNVVCPLGRPYKRRSDTRTTALERSAVETSLCVCEWVGVGVGDDKSILQVPNLIKLDTRCEKKPDNIFD